MSNEKKILELKYSAKRFGQMDSDERDMMANKILLKISVITGWVLPFTPSKMDMLIEEVATKMEETYFNLNENEVYYAFRNRGIDVKDWGKEVNLSLLDEILMPYLDNRADLSVQEEKISSQLPKEIKGELPPPKMSDEDWEEWLNDISKYEVNKIPCDSYEYLVRKGKIVLTAPEKHGYMERAIAHLSGTKDPNSIEGIEFARMKAKGEFSAHITGSLITISKRLAVFDYFHKVNQEPVKEKPKKKK